MFSFSTTRLNPTLTQGQISHLTGYSSHETKKLLNAGIIPSNRRDDVLSFCASTATTDLVQLTTPVPVVRLGEASLDYDGHRKLGFEVGYTSEEVRQAARKFWTYSPRGLEPYDFILVSYGSLVIGAYAYEGYDPDEIIYEIKEDTGKQITRWAYQFTELKTHDLIQANPDTPRLSESLWSPTQGAAASMVGYRLRTGPGQPVGVFTV